MPLKKVTKQYFDGGCPVPCIVIEIPENFNHLEQALREFAASVGDAMPVTKGGRAVDYDLVEQRISEATARLECAVHGDLLQALDVDQPRVVIEGREFAQVGRYSTSYYTLAGPAPAVRSLYREVGKRNAKTADPIALRAGAIGDGWLPRTAAAMAHELQKGTSREAEQSSRQMGRLPYSRSSFETVGHLVGEQHLCVQGDVEAALIEAYEVPREAHSVSVSLDRVSIPMEEPRPRPVGRPRKDAPKNPIERNYRMAYCGTVTLHDDEGSALHTIRYGRMPQGDSFALCMSIAGDLEVLLRKRPELLVTILQDGAPELWNLLDGLVTEEELGVPVHQLIDLWHLLEKLEKAALVIYGKKESRAVMKRWRLRLLNSERAASKILDALHDSGCEWVGVGDSHPVHDAITHACSL
ncbi:MAG: ISKra4 family transposase [Planctomycetota bacterium]